MNGERWRIPYVIAFEVGATGLSASKHGTTLREEETAWEIPALVVYTPDGTSSDGTSPDGASLDRMNTATGQTRLPFEQFVFRLLGPLALQFS